MAYGDFKDLIRRTASDKILRNKAFNISKNPKYDGYQRGLASTVYKFFDKKSAGGVLLIIIIIIITIIIIIKIMRLNKIYNCLKNYINQLLENFKKRKVYSGFRDKIWGADLADM